MANPLEAAADKLREEISAHLEELKANPLIVEIQKKQKALNSLEELLGVPLTKTSKIFALGASLQEGEPVPVEPDEFVHLSMLEAAKLYLRKAGKPARTIGEIIGAIRSGGGIVTAEDRLKIQLVRSTAEVKKVGEDRFGLLEWYPARKGRPPGSAGRSAEADEPDELAEEQQAGEELPAGTGADSTAAGDSEAPRQSATNDL